MQTAKGCLPCSNALSPHQQKCSCAGFVDFKSALLLAHWRSKPVGIVVNAHYLSLTVSGVVSVPCLSNRPVIITVTVIA